MAEARQFCTFYLENDFFGVDVQQVQEVLRYQDQTRVPLAPTAIRGLINLRGQIVTILNTGIGAGRNVDSWFRKSLTIAYRADLTRTTI